MSGARKTEPAVAAAGDLQWRQGETVLITGASSGIGREMARCSPAMARSLCSSRAARADCVSWPTSSPRHTESRRRSCPDLSQPAGPGEIVEALTQQHIDVDVLVNNARFGAHGPVAGIGVARQLEMIEVNVAALTRLTALLLPGMLERRRGAILNVASTAAFAPGPNQAVYCATKAYVLSFTEALAEEVAARACGLLPGSGGNRNRIRGAGGHGQHAAIPLGRDGRHARGPGRARWPAAGQDPW